MSKTIYRDLKNATEDKIKDLLEESQGQITGSNYEALGELMDIHKDITNEEYWCYKMEEGEDMRYEGYGRGSYGNYDNYGRGNYERDSYGRDMYSARGRSRDSRGRYRGHDYLDEMHEDYSRYMEGREKYGANEDTIKSLKYMLKSMEDFARMLKEDAQSDEEVEMIRQTAQRIAQM